jgi:anti-sigma regulatory factor (Ser/Thr protein kinase)
MTSHPGIAHEALLYRGRDELVEGVRAFLAPGVAAGAHTLIAVPGDRVRVLREGLGDAASAVQFEDMTELGRNPGRIIPALHDWLAECGHGPAWFVGEPIWPARRRPEIIEATRHEALLNLAFGDAPVSILCPYDAAGLETGVLEDASTTHPFMRCGDEQLPNEGYADPVLVYETAGDFPPPPSGAHEQQITADLGALRHAIADRGGAAGLADGRLRDLLVAVNEAATNALIHGAHPAVLRIWQEEKELICEVANRGRIEDPLTGRRRPGRHQHGGRGVWLMHQLCDLVELRPMRAGTTVRLHMDLA